MKIKETLKNMIREFIEISNNTIVVPVAISSNENKTTSSKFLNFITGVRISYIR